jgi:hypothetical protein
VRVVACLLPKCACGKFQSKRWQGYVSLNGAEILGNKKAELYPPLNSAI